MVNLSVTATCAMKTPFVLASHFGLCDASADLKKDKNSTQSKLHVCFPYTSMFKDFIQEVVDKIKKSTQLCNYLHKFGLQVCVVFHVCTRAPGFVCSNLFLQFQFVESELSPGCSRQVFYPWHSWPAA